jgi:hypothetical protein
MDMLALLAVLAGLLAPATTSETPLATDGHVVAWWGNTWGHDVALTAWRPGDAPPRRIAAVKPAPIGDWSLDVGRGPNGNLWAVYTSCTRGGCGPWGIDLRTGVRRSLGVGPGRDAALWGRRVVFARHGRLYRATVGRPRSARRVPMRRGVDVESTELRGDRVAYTTWESGDDARFQQLWSQRLGGPAPRRPLADGFDGEECTHVLTSPVLTARGLTYLIAGAGEPSVCGRGGRTALVTPTGRRPAAVGALAEVVVGGRTVVLAPPSAKARRGDRDRCARDAGSQVAGCEIRVD